MRIDYPSPIPGPMRKPRRREGVMGSGQGQDGATPDETWVFGYGSLIWRPGFPFAERRRATLHGYRRAFCMVSVHYRGTPEAPGLVLALDRDPEGVCVGVAYRLAPDSREATLAYLRERELVSYAYDEATLAVRLDDGRLAPALAYVTNRAHPQYRGGLSLDAQAEVIAHAVGPSGPNADYLMNTLEGLAALGLTDPELERLAELVRGRAKG
jgi:cation transport protein ChaC